MKWIDAGDIKIWVHSKQRHCAQTLPELVRRLIFATATATSIEEISFPGGDSIAQGGWDGHLKTSMISPFFPSGISGWEIGAERAPGKKAASDYKKRTAKPLGLRRQDTTFVFVTPRPWPGRTKWQSEKLTSRNRKWKDVRVIGADALEQWLDSAPAVALWLAKQVGKVVSGGIRDLESMWEEWSLATAGSGMASIERLFSSAFLAVRPASCLAASARPSVAWRHAGSRLYQRASAAGQVPRYSGGRGHSECAALRASQDLSLGA